MKRKNRKSSKKRRVQRKKLSQVRRTTRLSKKQQRTRRKKPLAFGKRKSPTDPRVARALNAMRRLGVSASVAARRERMKLETFRRLAGSTLYRSRPGKPWKARDTDKLPFSVTILTRFGPEAIIAKNYRERKLAGDYLFALRMWRAGVHGAEATLQTFQGKTIGGQTLITDTKLLTDLEEAGLLDFDSLYTALGARA